MKASANSAVPVRNIYFFLCQVRFFFLLEIVMSMTNKDKESNKLWPIIYFSPCFTSLRLFLYTLPVKFQPTEMARNDRKRLKWTKWIVGSSVT